MDLNKKIAKIPFWILFSIVSFLTVFSFIYTYASMDYPKIREGNPANHFLALAFSKVFNTSYENYFLYSIPFVLFLLFGAMKLAKWLVKVVDKRTDIKGDNHVAIIIILIMIPNVFHQIIATLFGIYLIPNPSAEFKYTTIIGVVLGVAYLILAEFIEPWVNKKAKR